MQSRYYERCDQIEVLEYKIIELRNLLARMHDELGEHMSAVLRNTIAKELTLPTAIWNGDDVEPLTPQQIERLTPQQIFERAWRMEDWRGDVDRAFMFDVPGTFVATLCGNTELGIGVTLTPAQAHAALEYWRSNMIRVVEKVAAQFRADIDDPDGSPHVIESPK
jgi:hypothetical protein